MDRLLLMQSFARVVETGSFSAVARELGIGQPNVSRHVAALERHLGTRLLHRSTRRLTLTPEGERYYGEARRVLDAIAEAESTARGEDTPSGLLRVACPTALSRAYVLPQLKVLLGRFPHMDVDLHIGDRFSDLIEEGLDLAIRIGILRDSALQARRIGTAERVCVASPAYLSRHPAPETPADLSRHGCIVYSLAYSGNRWPFRSAEVEVGGRLRVNSPDAIHRAVVDGLGVAYAPVWLFEEELRSGELEALLVQEMGPGTPINIVYPTRRLLPRRARVFMDVIAEAFSGNPVLNEGALQGLLSVQHLRGGGRTRRAPAQRTSQKQ
jgi:LysR family transcriptional regulator, regulator for bpeEF and oprC